MLKLISLALALAPSVAMAQGLPFEGPLQALGTSLTTTAGASLMLIAIAGGIYATLATDALNLLRIFIPLFIGGAMLLNAQTVVGLF